MAAGKYSFVIEQGSTFELELQYKDSTGTAVSLVGYSGRMQIRPSVTSATVYLALSSSLQADGTGINFSGSNGTTPPTSGSIGILISAVSSSALSFDQAVYDLEIVSGSIVTRLIIRFVKKRIRELQRILLRVKLLATFVVDQNLDRGPWELEVFWPILELRE